jgi:pyrophosphatase PpaX
MSEVAAGWRPDAVLFDLDGTLIDTTDLILRSFAHTFDAHLPGRLPSRDALIATFGTSLPSLLNEMAAAADDPDPAALAAVMLTTYRSFQHVHHDTLAQPFPGVREMLDGLRARGERLGLVTSKMEGFARRGLMLFGLESFLEFGVFHDDTARHKPDPEPLMLAASRAGVQPADVLYVGDSTHDIVAGRAAGMRTVAALWGPFDPATLAAVRPDFTASRPEDLLALVARLREGRS